MDSIKYQQIKNQQVTDSVRNLIMGHVWIFQTHNNPNTNLKNWSLSTKPSFCYGHSSPLTWTLLKIIGVNWREEASSWSCESEGFGEILDEGMVSGLFLGVLTSSGIIGENLELFNWQMEVSKSIEWKGAVNCGQCVFKKNIYFIMNPPPRPPDFKFLLSNESLDFLK